MYKTHAVNVHYTKRINKRKREINRVN